MLCHIFSEEILGSFPISRILPDKLCEMGNTEFARRDSLNQIIIKEVIHRNDKSIALESLNPGQNLLYSSSSRFIENISSCLTEVI